MPETKRSSFRLSPGTIEKIEEIADFYNGLKKTRVLEWAVEHLYFDVVRLEKKPEKKSRKSS
jgi:hypothetical protein